MKRDRAALVLGATGLVGRALTTFLLREPTIVSVTVAARRDPGVASDPKLRVVTTNFDKLDQHADAFRVDDVFCALGSTMRQSGTREQFYRVDHDYPVAAARLAYDCGATQFLLVSALGANPTSRIFYNRVKGETEHDVAATGFQSLTIARPSLLVGDRAEFRLGEKVGLLVGWLAPPDVRPISATDVAAALTLASRDSPSGVHTLTSRQMRGASMRLSHFPQA